MTTIEISLYSYKNKNLQLVVENLLNSSKHQVVINVYDQHPLIRGKMFKSYQNVNYRHIFWDWQVSPIVHKQSCLSGSQSEYFAIVSDDALLQKDWAAEAIDFLEGRDRDTIISGFGGSRFDIKDMFTLKISETPSENFTKTKVVNPFFVFGKTDVMKKIEYPQHLKYLGESELLSFSAFRLGIEVFSMPSSFVKDLEQKTLENKYKTFSLEHGYNGIHAYISDDFWKYLEFEACPIKRLPYNPDDVYYNAHHSSFDDLDSRKFISGVKAIY